MADKILHGIEMPICVGYGTEANLLAASGQTFRGELAISTDTGRLFFCPVTGQPFVPVVPPLLAYENETVFYENDVIWSL